MPWPHTTTLEDPLPLLADLTTCLRFFSRLPVPGGTDGTAMPSLAASIGMLPVAALPIAACTALPLWFGDAAGLPAALSATLGLMAGTLATGALHEDGLADTADGLGGGTPERKLAIMRDSRIGTFGVLALAFSLILRASALATLIGRDGIVATFAAIAGASALSRGLAILPMATLSPARPDGLGRGGRAPRAIHPHPLLRSRGTARARPAARHRLRPAPCHSRRRRRARRGRVGDAARRAADRRPHRRHRGGLPAGGRGRLPRRPSRLRPAMTVSSPCIGLCVIDPETSLCRGCARRLDEIAGWASLSEAQRRAIMARLPDRAVRPADPPPGTAP